MKERNLSLLRSISVFSAYDVFLTFKSIKNMVQECKRA